MRLVFMGSPKEVIHPLESLMTICSEENHSLVAVITQPARPAGRKKKLTDPPLAEYAKNKGLTVLQPESARNPEFLQTLLSLEPDIIITAAYGQILSSKFLSIPKRATINIHPSLLPRYRGATPVPSALLDGVETTGVTLLFTVKELDAGSIIIQKSTPVDPFETNEILTDRLFKLGGELLSEALNKLADPSFSGTPQAIEEVSHCGKVLKDDGAINWTHTTQQIFNRFRAYHPWPGSFTHTQKGRVVLTKISPFRGEFHDTKLKAGSYIFSKTHKALIVGTVDGMLSVTKIKPAGGKEMDAASFWNGLKQAEIGVFYAQPD